MATYRIFGKGQREAIEAYIDSLSITNGFYMKELIDEVWIISW